MPNRIVVVDDNPLILSLVARVLGSQGYVCLGFSGARAALESNELEGAQLLITDIFMPQMDGIELIRSVTAEYPHLPIVAMSGGGEKVHADLLPLANHLGAVATLSKPFRVEELLRVAAGVIGRSFQANLNLPHNGAPSIDS